MMATRLNLIFSCGRTIRELSVYIPDRWLVALIGDAICDWSILSLSYIEDDVSLYLSIEYVYQMSHQSRVELDCRQTWHYQITEYHCYAIIESCYIQSPSLHANHYTACFLPALHVIYTVAWFLHYTARVGECFMSNPPPSFHFLSAAERCCCALGMLPQCCHLLVTWLIDFDSEAKLFSSRWKSNRGH